MANTMEALRRALDFLDRYPHLEGSNLLKTESERLATALEKYNSKAEGVELSLKPDFSEVAALIEGRAKRLLTASFIKDFAKKYCSTVLTVSRADKRARTDLLMLAAKEQKLQELRDVLDDSRKYRHMLHRLMDEKANEIQAKILNMPAEEFKALVEANGLDVIRTGTGKVSTKADSRKKTLKHILRDKTADDLMAGLGKDA
jgi:hypothetical protein